MRQLLVAEAYQRLERVLVAQPIVAADFEQFCGNEALNQAEDIGVGAALDLAHQALFGVGK